MKRRAFVTSCIGAATVAATGPSLLAAREVKQPAPALMRFGLVTYMWGADWVLPTLLSNLAAAKVEGVELRTGHAHGVEPILASYAREEIKRRFADSPVTLVGLGCNEAFHHTDKTALSKSIEQAKQFVRLSHDVGGTGVKVKPNDLPAGVSHEQTIEQIGRALNELGTYAADLGQQVRLEVHGGCAPLPIIAAIMQVAAHPQVAVCWNCNPQDLQGDGLAHNLALVERRLGATTHTRALDNVDYPTKELLQLLKRANYQGWILLEDSEKPADPAAALITQRALFDAMVG